MPPAQCKTTLRQYCVPEPPQWGHMAHYDIRPDNATNTTQALQLTAQFLVRGGFFFALSSRLVQPLISLSPTALSRLLSLSIHNS